MVLITGLSSGREPKLWGRKGSYRTPQDLCKQCFQVASLSAGGRCSLFILNHSPTTTIFPANLWSRCDATCFSKGNNSAWIWTLNHFQQPLENMGGSMGHVDWCGLKQFKGGPGGTTGLWRHQGKGRNEGLCLNGREAWSQAPAGFDLGIPLVEVRILGAQFSLNSAYHRSPLASKTIRSP